MGLAGKESFSLWSMDHMCFVKHLETLYKIITKNNMLADIVRSQSCMADVIHSVTAH